MKVLVLNAGSSSLKYKVFEKDTCKVLCEGAVEEIGEGKTNKLKHKVFKWKGNECEKENMEEERHDMKDHHHAIDTILKLMVEGSKNSSQHVSAVLGSHKEICCVGHRVVHGGKNFTAPVVVSKQTLQQVEQISELAPLHNDANLNGVKAVSQILGNDLPQVMVFDTSFHVTIPPHAYLYAIPLEFSEKKHIRRYGFHGTSHYFVAKEASKTLGGSIDSFNLITIHLGNGSSMCAIDHGRSIDTSMGLTPLEGLVMGTRSGDIGADVALTLSRDIHEIEEILNKKSGLLGISGTNDMRQLLQMCEGKGKEGTPEETQHAQLALDIFCYRIKKYLGAYMAALGGLDAVVFTGGIGEHVPVVRQKSCDKMSWLGITIDEEKNNSVTNPDDCERISSDNSRVKVFVIPTNEELEIAQQTQELLQGKCSVCK